MFIRTRHRIRAFRDRHHTLPTVIGDDLLEGWQRIDGGGIKSYTNTISGGGSKP
jgi:hypothetical protein